MILHRLILLLPCIICLVTSASADIFKGYVATGHKHSVSLLIDSIDVRPELIRVYGRLCGTPHTSNRIDKLILSSDKYNKECNDIDGIDLKRWFQWEDDGIINLEIDFPPIRLSKNFTITQTGPKCNEVWTFYWKE